MAVHPYPGTVWKTWTTSSISTGSCSATDCSSTDVWDTWTRTYHMDTQCDANDTVWYRWCEDGGTSTTSTSNTVWYEWNSERAIVYPERDFVEETEEERESRMEAERVRAAMLEDQKEEQRKKYAEIQEQKRLAEEKAKQLLLDLIGKDQLAVYEETGRLFVRGNKYSYLVQKTGFVKRIEKDKITDLCVHLKNRHAYPDTDNVIAMKLLIENREDEVLRMANNHGSKALPDQLPRAAGM